MNHDTAPPAPNATQTRDGVRTALYRCFDADDELLYIGISKDPKTRFEQHRKSSPWWREAATRTIEWLDSRKDAERAERMAIQTEGPKYNDRLNPKTRRNVLPPGPGHRTLSDLYDDRGLTNAQARRIVVLLRLSERVAEREAQA